MTTFDERERAFEAKFAHDAEMRFRAEARAAMKLALWAARGRGLSGDDAVAYAKDALSIWIRDGGASAFDRVAGDLSGTEAAPDAASVAARFAAFLSEAKAELHDEKGA